MLVLACLALVHGKEADSCDAKVASLEKALKAMKDDYANLQKSANDMKAQQSEVPYFSAEVFTHSVGALRHFSNLAAAHGKAAVPVPEWVSMDKLAGPAKAAANASLAAFTKGKSHATNFAFVALETGKKSASAATSAALEAGKKAAPYAETYYAAGMELYEKHAKPAISKSRNLYAEKVHPHLGRHVGLAHEKLTHAAGATMEKSKTLIPLVQQYAEVARVNVQAQMNSLQGPIFDKLLSIVTKVTEPRSFTIGGRKFSFPWGFLDIFLLTIQVLVFSFVALVIGWKFFLKTLLWKIGLKLLGRKMLIGVSYSVIKVSYRITRLLVSITLYSVRKFLRLVYLAVLLVLFCAIGLGAALSAARGAAIAKPDLVVDMGIVLAAGLCLGLLLFLCVWCQCCCRKKATKAKAVKETKEQSKKKTPPPAKEQPPKQESKAGNGKTDAKQAPKNGKKR